MSKIPICEQFAIAGMCTSPKPEGLMFSPEISHNTELFSPNANLIGHSDMPKM